MASMKNMDTEKKLVCALCREPSPHCEPLCQSCLSKIELENEVEDRLKMLAAAIVEWAEKYHGTWADGSDAEVAFEELLEEARDLQPVEGRDED